LAAQLEEHQPKASDVAPQVAPHIAEFAKVLQTLQVLGNPTPGIADAAQQEVVLSIMGYRGGLADIKTVADALEQNQWWHSCTKEFRIKRVNEITIVPHIQKVIASLRDGSHDALDECIQHLAHWRSATRSGGTAELEVAIVANCAQTVTELESTPLPDDVKGLEVLMAEAVKTEERMEKLLTLVGGGEEKLSELRGLLTKLKEPREKISITYHDSLASAGIISFLTNPSEPDSVPKLNNTLQTLYDTAVTSKGFLTKAMECLEVLLEKVKDNNAGSEPDHRISGSIVDTALGMRKIMGEPSEGAKQLFEVFSIYKQAFEVEHATLALKATGCTPDERADSEDGEQLWSRMFLSMEAFQKASTARAALFEDKTTRIAQKFVQVAKTYSEGVMQRAEASKKEFADAMYRLEDKHLNAKLEDLSKYQHGMLLGSNWRTGLQEGCTFEEALQHANKTLFKQKGLKNKMEYGILYLDEALMCGTKELSVYGYEVKEELREQCNSVLAQARATLSEAAILQLLRDGVTTNPSSSVKALVSAEATFLAKHAVDTQLLLPSVWAVVQAML